MIKHCQEQTRGHGASGLVQGVLKNELDVNNLFVTQTTPDTAKRTQ
jgi:hypothetical protein